jgi:Spy/CpxP family protein refolding chaperone
MKPVMPIRHVLLIALACALPRLASAGLPTTAAPMAPAPHDCARPLPGPGMGAPDLPPPPGALPLPPYLRGVTLSEAQQDALFDLMHGLMRAMREPMKTMARIESDLRALPFSPDYEDAKARALIENLAIAQAQARLLHMRADRQIYTLLTPEQRRQIVIGQVDGMAPGHAQHAPIPSPRPGMASPDGFRGAMQGPPMAR